MSKILLIVGGSVAACKVPQIISLLKTDPSIEMRCILTNGGARFITAETLACLTGNKVYQDAFETPEEYLHIELARWADLIVVLPASASLIGRWATGQGNDLAGMLFLADGLQTPSLLIPAMNTAMWEHPATKSNCETLNRWGVYIMQPAEGILACGETGRGRLPEPEAITHKIRSFFQPQAGRVLITYGAISVSIDTMRQISNLSSGNTGRLIASSLSRNGYSVEVIHSNTSKPADHCINFAVSNFNEFQTKLDSKLQTQQYDAVLMLAAVPDYAPISVELGQNRFNIDELKNTKLPSSDSDQMVIHLRRTPKLIDRVKSHQKTTLVGFKFTAEEPEGSKAVESLINHSNADYVLHNWKSGINDLSHKFCLYDNKSNLLSRGNNKSELTAALKSILERKSQ